MNILKRILKIVSSKACIVGLLVLIQLFIYIYPWFKLSASVLAIDGILRLAAIFVVVYIAAKNDNPSYKITWIICILILPALGISFYLLFGAKKVPKKLIERDEELAKVMNRYLEKEEPVLEEIKQQDKQAYKQSKYLHGTIKYPIYKHTKTKFYPIGEKQFEDMIQLLKSAESFIFLEFFIINKGYMWDTILSILKEKARQGVDVRILYDDFGSIDTFGKLYRLKLHTCGIKVKPFNPLRPRLSIQMNNRNHRKILIVDGKTAMTGGINISDEYINKKERFGHWKDSGCCIYGEAVWSFTLMFLQFWNYDVEEEMADDYMDYHVHAKNFEDIENDGYVQPFSDEPTDDENVGECVHINMINAANEYVYITTPYLILDNEMKQTLKLAAKNGVDVRLLVPHIPDKKLVFILTRSNYDELTKSGVRIYEYTPGFVHSKTFVCDDKYAVVGTTNMDFRSYYLHYECGCFFYRSSLIKDIKEDYLQTLEKAKEITYEEYKQTNFWIRMARDLLNLIAPLM